MQLIITKSSEEMSRIATNAILGNILSDTHQNIAVTAGRTPLRVYELLKEAGIHRYHNVTYHNFDEMPILDQDNKLVGYETLDYLTKVFYNPCKIAKDQISHLNETNWQTYERDLLAKGGLDLMLIGLGDDGHFCGNMPETTDFAYEIYDVELKDEYPWNRPYQNSIAPNHCDHMVTMGPRTIMKVKKLIMIVDGEAKADMLKECLEGPVTSKRPSSVLRLHPNFVLIADEAAAAKLNSETLKQVCAIVPEVV